MFLNHLNEPVHKNHLFRLNWSRCIRLWLEGINLRTETKNKLHFLPIRLCFIKVYTYPNHKPTPYNNAKTVINVVQCDKK